MALKSWYETMGASDCFSGHTTWNDMVNYIEHSACTDFTIHSTCTSGGQAFRFTHSGIESLMYGGTNAGDNLKIQANDADTYPYVNLLGGGDAEIWVDNGDFLWFYENGIKAIRLSADSNDSQICGRDNTLGHLSLFANSIDAYPYIKLEGSGDIEAHYNTARDITFLEQANERFKFEEHQIDFNADRAIYINDDNTFLGHGAGDNIVAGTNNTLVGHDTGQANNFSSCVFLGYEAGKNNTQDSIVALGYQALLSNTGLYNTAVGCQSMDAACTGSRNTAFGYNTLSDNLGGGYNVAVGFSALENNTTGNFNTIVGKEALQTNTVGDGNVAVGTNAGKNATNNLDYCTYLGFAAGDSNATSNRLYLNNSSSMFPLIYGEFDNDVVKFGDNSAAWNIQFMQSRIHMLETTTPGAIANYGAIYCKADNKLYFQDGAGVEHEVAFV